jgi:hypothetical protein
VADGGDITVLCITGWCRSGSTILGNILNEVDGFFHAGELAYLWKNAYGHGSNTRCGCGRDLRRCPVWSGVLAAEAPGGEPSEAHARAVVARQAAHVRTRHTWQVLDGAPPGVLCEHAATMTRTYRAIAALTGCRVIVDSTKIPGEAALLPRVEGIRPLYLHLVRDPRAVAHSWMAAKDYAPAMSALRSTAYWLGFNLASHAIVRRHRDRARFLHYEDFVAEPARVIDELLAFCGADPGSNPVRGRAVELRPNHTVTGNPDRFRHGSTVIRDGDAAWRRELPRRLQALVLAMSWPLVGRYQRQRHGGAP